MAQTNTSWQFKEVRGNHFEFSEMVRRYYYMTDPRIPKDDEQAGLITVDGHLPIKVNGEKIYDDRSLPPVFPENKNLTFSKYLLRGIEQELSVYPDGEYYLRINNIVISATGKVIYYRYDEAFDFHTNTYDNNGTDEQRDRLNEKIKTLLDGIEMIAPKYNGKEVATLLPEPFVMLTIVIKDHRVTVL
jgi:hypothetical protein